MGRECLMFPPLSTRKSGGDSNSSECALWEPSGFGWAGPGLARALWMRTCKGMDGGWLGGSVVGLGGSACTAGTGPEEELLAGWSEWTLGGDGGMWDGGEGKDSVEGRGAATFVLSSLFSPLRTAGGSVTGVEAGSVVGDSGAWLGGEGSTEWRLVTGVILFGGVGGERLAGAGTMMTPLPGCESSAVKKKKKVNKSYQHLSYGLMPINITCSQSMKRHSQSAAGEVSFINKNKQRSFTSFTSFSCYCWAGYWVSGGWNTKITHNCINSL